MKAVKSILRTAVIASLTCFSAALMAQEYRPTAVEGANWVHTNTRASGVENYSYVIELAGDTVVDNIEYKKVYRRNMYFDWLDRYVFRPEPPYNVSNQKRFIGMVRDDTASRQLFGRYFLEGNSLSADVMLHDFSLGVGDTLRGEFFAVGGDAQVINQAGDEFSYGATRLTQRAARSYYEGVVSSNYGL